VFYLDSPKDEVMHNIATYYDSESERKAKKEKYEVFIKQR